jgi:hypothetical protein
MPLVLSLRSIWQKPSTDRASTLASLSSRQAMAAASAPSLGAVHGVVEAACQESA